jgi:copper homeostasis protein
VVLLEVVVDAHEAIRRAVAGGAGRLEVCARLDLAGLTPQDDVLAAAVATGVPCMAMVRPRGGSHVWKQGEHVALLQDVARVRALGAQGVVAGAITDDGRVDRALVAALVAAASPAPVTFHRAFDATTDPFEALETLVDLGVARILTSGGAADAFAGRFRLRELVERARGRIGILPGGGVRAHNAAEILTATGVSELHSSTVFRLPDRPR